MINITDNAKTRIVDLLIIENDPRTFLRTFVQGGGCAGMQYGFTFDQDLSEDDFVIDLESFKLAIDSVSMQYLEGATIDYKQDLLESRFVIQNPNSTGSCGCGSSFSI